MAAKLLKMTNISKSFGSNKVLEGIEIEVDRGEVVALLGENGDSCGQGAEAHGQKLL